MLPPVSCQRSPPPPFSATCRTFPTCIPSAQLILYLISGMHWLLHPCISICPCPTCSCELWCLIIRCHLHSCCIPLRSCFLQLFFGLIVSPMPDSICSVFCCNHIRCSLLGRLFVVAHFAALAENALTSFCKNLCFGNSFPSRAFSAVVCFNGIKLGPLTEKQGKDFFFFKQREVPVRWERLNIARIEFNFIWRVWTHCLDWTKTWCSSSLCTQTSTFSRVYSFSIKVFGTSSSTIILHIVVETGTRLKSNICLFVVVFLCLFFFVLTIQKSALEQMNETELHWYCRLKKTYLEFAKKKKKKKVNQRLTPCSVRRDKSRACRREEHSRLSCSDTTWQ